MDWMCKWENNRKRSKKRKSKIKKALNKRAKARRSCKYRTKILRNFFKDKPC